jgi:hypothetical protein
MLPARMSLGGAEEGKKPSRRGKSQVANGRQTHSAAAHIAPLIISTEHVHMSTSRYKLLVPWFVCVSYMSAQPPASDLVFIINAEGHKDEGKLAEAG